AIRAAGTILPKVNSWGGTNSQVKEAVELIEEVRAPERLFARAAGAESDAGAAGKRRNEASRVHRLRAEVRLALEMAAHEESERRALEGELALLELAWREAEEIASIADRLLVPEAVEEKIRSWKRQLIDRN
ncbi:MAG: hypothetical protein JSU87_15930, partial [Gemmatimonadota bacterium]